MSEKTWPQGTPCWVDLTTSDLQAALAFYTSLFDWTALPGSEEFGGYTMLESDGRVVAGAAPQMQATMEAGVPPAWNTYLAVDSADEIAAAVTAAGGEVHMGPLAIADVGRMAFCADPQGVTFGLWQAGTHKGFQKWNEPVSVVWDELETDDPEAAASFYTTVFGIETGEEYGATLLRVGGQPVASIDRPEEGQAPGGWGVLFSVADTDAVVARAGELGGAVVRAPQDFPFGRVARLRDPLGATFAVGAAPPGHG
jgi:predicted enzyme related to lactoylglutathione lyase